MDYVDAATTNILSPDILSVEDLRSMFRHIESELASTMHLPISSDNTLHFYWYLNTHVIIAEAQFLLLTDMPIQNRAQQHQIYEVLLTTGILESQMLKQSQLLSQANST